MKNITIGEFIVESQNNFPGSSGELSKILSAIKLASKIVSHHINKAGLAKDTLSKNRSKSFSDVNLSGSIRIAIPLAEILKMSKTFI